MNIFYCSLFFLFAGFCISTVHSAEAILPPVEKPKDLETEEGCYVPSLEMVLPYNVPHSPQNGKSCVEYTCGTDGYTTIFSCGVIAVGDNCYIQKGDKSLQYPDCCDKPAC